MIGCASGRLGDLRWALDGVGTRTDVSETDEEHIDRFRGRAGGWTSHVVFRFSSSVLIRVQGKRGFYDSCVASDRCLFLTAGDICDLRCGC